MKAATSYKKVSQLSHVLKRPAMYVGSCERITRKCWAIVDGEAVIIHTDTAISVPHLLEELTSNVADNVDESRKAEVEEGECVITVEGGRITISNEGLCIPIEKDKEHDILIPVMIFSDMLTGSNLGDEIDGGGAHGIGCKAVGALSSEFRVDIKNSVQKKSFSCTWRNNYSICEEPIVERYVGKKSSVTISYVLDHKRFGYEAKRRFAYSEADISMFKWIAACLSFTAQIPVTFNGDRMEYDLLSYSKLYVSNPETHNFKIETDTVRCIVLDTPGRGKQVGFANHIINSLGGTHVNAAAKIIKERVTLLKKGDKISLADIKPHVTILISVTGIKNPGWGGGQMKTSLTSPQIAIDVSDKILKNIVNWGLMTHLDAKTFSKFGVAESTSKRGRHIKTKSGEDATLAGTKESSRCDLYMVEGDSAEGYASELLNFIQGGRRIVGTFVMRGKLLNVLKASDKKIQKNRELNELAIRLGLKVGADYSEPRSIRELRYGKLIIMTDADEDGQHIKGLVLAFFHRFYPSLLQTGFIFDYMTPCMRATRGKIVKKFFFDRQYEDWKSTVDIKLWSVRYFKGLGASETADIQQDYEDKREISMVYDEQAPNRLELAMGKGEDASDLRKEWMKKRDGNASITVNKKLPISEFVDYFMRNYSYSTLRRNMNTLQDGLTQVARMIVYGAFNYFGRQCTSTKHPKVTDFAGTVGILAHYHHGDSIQGSVITLARDYVGSNNLPLLIGKGRFGSMEKGGKHAAQPRYLEVRPSPLLPLIFKADDDAILKMREVEGHVVEPECFYPIIPLSMVNGVRAVSTGWKSSIPNYNPLQVIDALLDRIEGKAFGELVPWYRGYPGRISLQGSELTCTGIVRFSSRDSYILSCLPVGVWNNKYKKFLIKKVLDKDIDDYESECTATKTWFNVKGFKMPGNRRPTLREIQAETVEKLTDLTLLGVEGLPVEYYCISALLEDFYEFRLPLYDTRKEAIIRHLEAKLKILLERRAYVDACLNGSLKFDVEGQPRDRRDVLTDIEKLGLRREFYMIGGPKKVKGEAAVVKVNGYSEVKQYEMDTAGIEILDNKIAKMEDKIAITRELKKEDMWRDDLLALRQAYCKIYTE